MTLYSYVVARDFGFAPNPFGPYCTLATCKPRVRAQAGIGDWIVGTGSVAQGRAGRLIFAMKVAEAITFDEYWNDSRFAYKRPRFDAALKQAYGDNIYHHEADEWVQLNSHHSYADGSQNQHNINNDTQTNRVLVGTRFAYWGMAAPPFPNELRNFEGHDICIGRGHKKNFPPSMVDAFVQWFESLGAQGFCGRPGAWE